jgi:alkylation response protein AidB-like acyl-CoA dehydrogenase
MDFSFSEDQKMFQETLRDFLSAEHTSATIRELWDSETRRSSELWQQLCEIGIMGLLVPEEYDGMGMDEVDLVLCLEEMGTHAFAEPVIPTLVGTRLLADLADKNLAQEWLPKVAGGEAILAVQYPESPFVQDAHVANLLILQKDGELHALTPDQVKLTRQDSNDPGNCLFSVDWTPSADTLIAKGEEAAKLSAEAFDRGALAAAAQLLGCGQRMIHMACEYANERKQFGVLIGTFQAIKHMCSNAQVQVEYVRPAVYRAAFSVANNSVNRSVNVSMAKLAAAEAAHTAGRVSMQVHGGQGYTWEQDLHLWMRRTWSLDLAWGSKQMHSQRIASVVIDGAIPTAPLGESWLV